MTKTTWRKGAPPGIGWWPASSQRDKTVHRWWNGRAWSVAVHYSESAQSAGEQAIMECSNNFAIEWSVRWWL
jgi:hypothetical protein